VIWTSKFSKNSSNLAALFLIGLAQSVFLAALLLRKPQRSYSDILLGSWMLVVAVHFLLTYFRFTGIDIRYPHLLGLVAPIPLLHGPMLYWYADSLIRGRERFQRVWLWHLLPAVGMLLSIIPYLAMSGSEKIHFIQEVLPTQPPFLIQFFTVLTQLSGLAYSGWILWMLRGHRRNIGEVYSYKEEVDLHWLRPLSLGLLGVWVVVFVLNFLFLVLDFDIQRQMDIAIFSAVTIFVFLIGWNGVRQGRIFSAHAKEATEGQAFPDTEKPEPRYHKSGLSQDQALKLKAKLTAYMEEHEPYLQGKLTLAELAKTLDLPPNHLSQVINSQFNQNFYEFINTYRVNKFKKRLEMPENRKLTLLANALESGFQSKSSFNEVFKKLTGQTPSQYYRSLSPERD
jgi:AraC-like DNA-binding protein